jgi:3-hydroxybutyrate dehydrogenase
MKMTGSDDFDWVTPEEVAAVMLATIQQDRTSVKYGDSEACTIIIEGGTIIEVSKRIRPVMPFNDPGPGVRETVAGMVTAENKVWDSLGQEGWGKLRKRD